MWPQPEPIDLLDLYVGAKWSVLVPESLPARRTNPTPQDRVVELCVTDIDEAKMHEILYALSLQHLCRIVSIGFFVIFFRMMYRIIKGLFCI